MAFCATCNLRRYLLTNRDQYDSFILCERHHVAHVDLRHVRFQFRSTCILVRIVDSESCQFRKSFYNFILENQESSCAAERFSCPRINAMVFCHHMCARTKTQYRKAIL